VTNPAFSVAIPSVQSLQIETYTRLEKLAGGTGFVVADVLGRGYLITNYHVAAGRDPGTGQVLSSTGADVDRIRVNFFKSPDPPAWEKRSVKTRDRGDDDRPLWLEHPTYGRTIDVVAVPLPNSLNDLLLLPISLDPPTPAPQIRVAEDLSIVGYPFGLTAGAQFPIWMRGTVASEPEVNYDGKPIFLIDARTREGQSGSPVLYYSDKAFRGLDGNTYMGSGMVTQLLGVYSGRIDNRSDIGRVIKTKVIHEILTAQKPGRD